MASLGLLVTNGPADRNLSIREHRSKERRPLDYQRRGDQADSRYRGGQKDEARPVAFWWLRHHRRS